MAAVADTDGFPDVHELFLYYDTTYFDNQLSTRAVSVKWSSKRMTLCAGICQYRGKIGGCEIVLSQPLLQYRSLKDMKETLLHEMIHAILFVTENNTDHDGHGPNFKRWMGEINKSTVFDAFRPAEGYAIDIYHNFHAEVDLYRQHIWNCDRCRQTIKRSMNRPPTEKDCRHYRKDGSGWVTGHPNRCGDNHCSYHNHARICGGTWVKTASPAPTATSSAKRVIEAKPSQTTKRPKTAPSTNNSGHGGNTLLDSLLIPGSPGLSPGPPAAALAPSGSSSSSSSSSSLDPVQPVQPARLPLPPTSSSSRAKPVSVLEFFQVPASPPKSSVSSNPAKKLEEVVMVEDSPPPKPSLLIRHLLEMGFPDSPTVRVVAESAADISEALTLLTET
eukprot:NODE_2538_length_1395_cov_87.165881_g2413_i0.p1 GENE.NODE_2538_length_1395_cov_87.165881_g2413_i0~~NODE_2538_length_1395_cov_87.165881_g2413_i0.p1  ORF type:complete len:389 (-),score=63.49 NODE_2538_length_1395_cov_87.165881_g2413_i0:137-1303(-)